MLLSFPATSDKGRLMFLWIVLLLGLEPAWRSVVPERVEGGVVARRAPLAGVQREGAPSEQPSFVEQTIKAGISFRHVRGGSGSKFLPETFGSGGAFFDYDGDGWLDIYLVNGAALPGWNHSGPPPTNALYRNERDGTFKNVTAEAGVGDAGYGMGCAVADYNNDGLLDLYVTNFGPDVLYRNNGDGTFSNVTRSAGLGCDLWGTSAGFADVDRDGDVDLYVANYVNFSFDNHKTCRDSAGRAGYCHPTVYDGLQDVLYVNDGNGTFADATGAAGITAAQGRGLGVVFGDYDEDGDVDIYVANDTDRNLLWRNRGGGTFEEVGLLSGVAVNEMGVAEGGMGTDLGDYDNDGVLDLLVANYDMETNTIYRNTGRRFFADVTDRSGMGAPSLAYVGFGAAFLDYDNDRDLDIFIANGHIMEGAAGEGGEVGHEQPNFLFRNDGWGRFENVSGTSGVVFSTRRSSRGAAFGDYDNDGDVDILVNNSGASVDLLRNDGGNRNNKLIVELVGVESNRDGIAATLVLRAGGTSQLREVHGAYSYCSHNDLRVAFGLGDAGKVDRLDIRWPNGLTQSYTDLPVDQWIVIKEGSGILLASPLR